MDDLGCFAMALDPCKRQVRSISSTAGHCIGTGIAEQELAMRTLQRTARHRGTAPASLVIRRGGSSRDADRRSVG